MNFAPSVIQHWAIDRLRPYERNARTHSAEQIQQIVRSIQEFGFTNPILVDADAGILAGHARLDAARTLALETVPVIVLEHLSDAQRRAYILADNKLALNAGWDDQLLIEELTKLEQEGFALELIGFSSDELEELLAGELIEADPESVPGTAPTPVSRPGETWLLGPHRVRCGDATLASDVEDLMRHERAAMVFSDPPYNVRYAAGTRPIANDDLGTEFLPFLTRACANILAHTDGAIYLCMSSSELHTLYRAFTEAGGHWSTFLIWAKDSFTLGHADYQRQFEPILYGWREGGQHYWCGDRAQGDVWFVDKPRANKLHPTMKPVELIVRAVRNSTRTHGLVLDPFGGAGSTLIACETTGRHARILELDPLYVDVIVRRWQDFTGRVAVRESDGSAFPVSQSKDEVAQ